MVLVLYVNVTSQTSLLTGIIGVTLVCTIDKRDRILSSVDSFEYETRGESEPKFAKFVPFFFLHWI